VPAVRVEIDRDRVLPGEMLGARIHVDEVHERTQGLAAGLVLRNRFLVQGKNFGRDNHSSRRFDVMVQEVAGSDVSPGTYETSIQVPTDAPPSCARMIEWRAFAELRIAKKLDQRTTAAFEVLATPGRLDGRAVPAAFTATWLRREFEGLDQRDYRPGDTVAGTLTLISEETVGVDEITVMLRSVNGENSRVFESHFSPEPGREGAEIGLRHIRYADRRSVVAKLSRDRQVVAEKGERLVAGEPSRFPFELEIPSSAVPTLWGPNTRTSWEVAAQVNREGWGGYVDLEPLPLCVHNLPRGEGHWLPDPWKQAHVRWWDGERWTGRTG
jgi:hypothetical protein